MFPCLPHACFSYALSGSLENHSKDTLANNSCTKTTVADRDLQFAPLHRQVFATRKLAILAATTVHGRFLCILGQQLMYACYCEDCDSKRYVQHDQAA